MDSSGFLVISDDPRLGIVQAKELFESNSIPYKYNNSRISSYGSLIASGVEIVFIPYKIQFMEPTGVSNSNKSVQNRLVFAGLVQQAISKTAKPFDISFNSDKKVLIRGVTGIKFLGDSIADIRLVQGSANTRLSINMMDGVYHTKIQNRSVKNAAHDALVKAAESGLLNATVDNNDYMDLHQPVAIEAPRSAIRDLITSHIKGGYGIVSEFNKNSFSFDGKSNTLSIKCDKIFKTSIDLMADDTPYIIITNSKTDRLFDIKGVTLDLVAKRNLPSNTTFIHI